ncbi:hypothetical protein TREMEDRAFT_64461 [Tremella mesenterica DSM 1558]|uniref:uncharacterized protein n=1 Tax=Tremella mesenterica (strain ATCC 24925 / CBS 8224 / DSM 1558 / NBRC 9311 / NRRL Y-6157 / RJB 2259-6 / UBC 559-6) TaxID=578456 RepID=UPI0003F4A0B9|nr:uncharacterized protein TREMEDRAFT_64461 [Tremella mesenterica DSM 1558]EIW67217.1 hypothetical protein TREMEDRAFT_64461 [Tremella mesenterica DSM 1558]
MTSRSELDAYRSLADRFTAARKPTRAGFSQQGNSPRQVLSMGFGALAITDGSPSVAAPVVAPPAAAASVVVPPIAVSPVAALTPLSTGQQDVRPAPVGLPQTPGHSATVVEIDDDDEEMGGDDRDKEMDDVLFVKSRGPKLDEVKSEKRRWSSPTQGEVRPPSAKQAKDTRSRSPSVLDEVSPSPAKEPGSARKALMREQERLWKLFSNKRERWEVASVDESCDRCCHKIITYGRTRWLCLPPVKPHNCGSRCASCTSGPCSCCPPNTARDIPPRSSAPLGPPYTPSTAVRHRLPTAQDKEFPSPSPSANFSSPGPTSPSPAVRCPPNSPVAGPSRLPATPLAGLSRCTPRRGSSAALRPSTPGAGPSCLPATPSAASSRPTRSHPTPVSTQEDSSLTLPPALGTQSRQPSVPPATGLSTPAPPVQTPPSKSSKGKGKKKKAVQFEPAVVENESTQLPEEIPPPLDHPYIFRDPQIPEEEKQLATFRSLSIGLITQLHANRQDTAKLLEYCMKLVSGMNTLSRTMATLVNSSDIGPLAQTEEYALPPTLDWLRPPNPARLSSQDGAFLNILALPLDCLRTLRQLWKLPSLDIARDSALHNPHILASNTAWRETRSLRRVALPKVTESSSGGRPAPGSREQGGSSQQSQAMFVPYSQCKVVSILEATKVLGAGLIEQNTCNGTGNTKTKLQVGSNSMQVLWKSRCLWCYPKNDIEESAKLVLC